MTSHEKGLPRRRVRLRVGRLGVPGGVLGGAMQEQWAGGSHRGQPPVGHGAAFVPPVYNTQVGTSPVPVPGMSQQAHEIERLLEEARLQMAWGIEVPHQQYCERVQQIYASMPVGGSGLSSSLMAQVGTGTVPVAGPSGCVPPAPRGQGTRLLLGSRVGQPRGGWSLSDRWGEHPCGTARNTGFQVVRHRRDGAPGPRPASAGRETGSRVSGASPSGSGVPRSRSHSRENVRPRASGPQGPRPQCWGSATGRLIQSGRLVQGRLVGGVALSKRSATTAIRRGTVLASVPSRGFCWGSAIPRCQGSSCSRAAAMLWGGEGCCSPRKGGNAGVGALSGFRPVRRGIGPHQGFVAGRVGIGGAGTFGGSRAVWCHAGHHPGFGACGGWGLAAWCCSSRGWGPVMFGGVFACFGAGGVHPGWTGLWGGCCVLCFLWQQEAEEQEEAAHN